MSYLNRVPKKMPVQVPPQAKQVTKTVPSPIGGLNSRDPINAMPETDAYALINWIPTAVGLTSRSGYMEWTTGVTNPIQSIFQYFAATSTIPTNLNYGTFPTTLPGQVFFATKDGIFNTTNKGAVGATVKALSGLASAGLLVANSFTNAAGNWQIVNSEADGYITYDGVSWVSVVAGVGPTQMSGADPTKLVYNLPFKNRLWFVERASTKLWYLPTSQIYGAAISFDVGPFFKHGGAVSYIANWTIDAGTGIDDHLVVVGENGDVLIYKGTDPNTSNAWALVGSWQIGEVPKGRKAWVQYGGDLLLLSTGGLFPVSYLTRGGANLLQASDKEYTSKIQKSINADLGAYFNLPGWEVTFVYRNDLIIITVPDNSGGVSKQYAMSTITNQWTVFSGIPVQCSAVCSGFYLFGTSGSGIKLGLFGGTDAADGTAANGNPIVGFILPAFTAHGYSGFKHYLMVRPVFISTSPPVLSMQMNTDYATNAPVQGAAYAVPQTSRWDVAAWDAAVWGGSPVVFDDWYSVNGSGYVGTLALTTTTVEEAVLAEISYMMELGGPM